MFAHCYVYQEWGSLKLSLLNTINTLQRLKQEIINISPLTLTRPATRVSWSPIPALILTQRP